MREHVCICVHVSVHLYICICVSVCVAGTPHLSVGQKTQRLGWNQSPSDPLPPTMLHNSKNSANIWVPTVYNQKPVGAFFIQIIPNWATENEGAMVQSV